MSANLVHGKASAAEATRGWRL